MNYDRIILELMDRVSALEDEVNNLKVELKNSYNQQNDDETKYEEKDFVVSSGYNGRDTTKYILDGKRYGKNRLVLAVVQKYIKNNPDTTSWKLMTVFDRSLQGSLGVIRTLNDVKTNYSDYERRFFCQPNEIIHTATEDCVVCTQWGKFNIDNIVARAKELGINITTI